MNRTCQVCGLRFGTRRSLINHAIEQRHIQEHVSVIPAVVAMQREVGRGKCPFCEDPLVVPERSSYYPVHCGGRDCQAGYHRLYRDLRTARCHAKGITTRGKKLSETTDPRAGKLRYSCA